jgi:hypothetical protein
MWCGVVCCQFLGAGVLKTHGSSPARQCFGYITQPGPFWVESVHCVAAPPQLDLTAPPQFGVGTSLEGGVVNKSPRVDR